MTYDAIIVGAGHNGLAAPSIWPAGLEGRGLRAQHGGGRRGQDARSDLPGFRHDLFAMNLGLFAGSPFLQPMARR